MPQREATRRGCGDAKCPIEQETPALQAFLGLLDEDINAGLHLQPLPDDLVRTMQAFACHGATLDEDFEDDVAL